MHRMLEERLQASGAAEEWAGRCREAYPWASYFNGSRATPPSVLSDLLEKGSNRATPSVLRAQDV